MAETEMALRQPELVGVAEIAEWLGITDRRVQQLAVDGVIPRAARGRYDLRACVCSYTEHLRSVAAGHTSADGALDLTEERARLAREQADGQALKNAQLRGELIPRDELQPALEQVLAIFRSRMRALPIRVAQAVPRLGRDAIQSLQELHDEALTELADALDRFGADEDADPSDLEDGPAATAADTQPVG